MQHTITIKGTVENVYLGQGLVVKDSDVITVVIYHYYAQRKWCDVPVCVCVCVCVCVHARALVHVCVRACVLL